MSAFLPFPRFIGIGGSLKALLTGLTGSCSELPRFSVSPLLLVLWLPLIALLPPLAMLMLVKLQAKQGQRSFYLKAMGSAPYLSLLSAELLYFIFLYLIYAGVGFFTQQALADYLQTAAEHQVLQIGTPEQLAYAQHVVRYWQCAGGAVCFVLYFIASLSLSALLGAHGVQSLQLACLSLIKNLPALLLLILIAITVGSLIEHYFASVKIAALQGRFHDEFVTLFPYVFIVLRLYVLHALALALCLSAAAAAGVLHLSVKRSSLESGPTDVA